MAIELARLCRELLITAFHKWIADFIMERERSLVLTFRSRGMPLPAVLTTQTARNLYFGIGIFIVVVECLRIYQIGH
jgi:hypothetical protein